MSVGRMNRTGSVNGNSAFSLTKTHVSDCVLAEKPKILHKLDADRDTVEDAIVLLTENKIYAAPVVDSSGYYVGYLTKLDIMSFLLAKFPSDAERFTDYFESIRTSGFELLTKCRDVVSFSKSQVSNPIVSSSLDMSILFAMKLLNSSSLLRIPVLDEAGKKPVCILSQYDLIRFLAKHEKSLPLTSQTLEELGLAKQDANLVKAMPNEMTIHVVKKLVDHHLPGIPIMDATGKHIAHHFSASDVKVTVDSYAWLSLPISSALSHASTAVHAVQPHDTLARALNMIVKYHVHSIYVMGDGKEVIRLLSLSDILNVFCNQPE